MDLSRVKPELGSILPRIRAYVQINISQRTRFSQTDEIGSWLIRWLEDVFESVPGEPLRNIYSCHQTARYIAFWRDILLHEDVHKG